MTCLRGKRKKKEEHQRAELWTLGAFGTEEEAGSSTSESVLMTGLEVFLNVISKRVRALEIVIVIGGRGAGFFLIFSSREGRRREERKKRAVGTRGRRRGICAYAYLSLPCADDSPGLISIDHQHHLTILITISTPITSRIQHPPNAPQAQQTSKARKTAQFSTGCYAKPDSTQL